MNKKTPFQTHKYHAYEKYYSIIVELLNLYKVIAMYKHKGVIDSTINKSILALKGKLESEYNTIKILEPSDFLEFLVRLDVIKINLENKVKKIGLIHHKVIQSITESSPHINPLPPLQKRYSSKILSNLLDEHHKTLFSSLSSNNNNITLSSIWSHDDNYSVHSINDNHHFTKHSFYYHDIAWIIPAIIDHEVILMSIKNNTDISSKLVEISKKIENSMKEHIEALKTKYNDEYELKKYFDEFQSFIDTTIEKTLYELTADYIGYKLHGKAYTYSLYHETLGEYFGRDFLKDTTIYGTIVNYVSLGIDIQRESLLIRHIINMDFNKSDTSYYMFYVKNLSKLINHGNKSETNLTSWMKMKSKNTKATVDKDKQSTIGRAIKETEFYTHLLSTTIYQISINFTTGFKNSLDSLTRAFLKKNTNNPFFDNKNQSISTALWEERNKLLETNCLPHRSTLRQKLLNNLGISGTFEPYILHYRHTALSTQMKHDKTITFGSYNKIHIEPIENIQINIEDKIEKCLQEFDTVSEHLFFENKHTLLKIGDAIKPYNGKDNQKIKVYILIHLSNDTTPTKIIDIAQGILKQNDITKYTQKLTIFKSFGPEDIVVETELTSIHDIWNFIEEIRRIYAPNIKETFSSIVLENLNPNATIENDMWIKSFYRVKAKMGFEDFFNKASNIQKLRTLLDKDEMQIYDITDDYYDFEIWWTNTSLDTIDAFTRNIEDVLIDAQHYIVSGKKYTNEKARRSIDKR